MLIKKKIESSFNWNKLDLEKLDAAYESCFVFDSNAEENTDGFVFTKRIIALGTSKELSIRNSSGAIKELQRFIDEYSGWKFGYISYDLKNDIEELNSVNNDELNFFVLNFVVPDFVIECDYDATYLWSDSGINADGVQRFLSSLPFSSKNFDKPFKSHLHTISSRLSRDEYVNIVEKLKTFIQKGDVYEVNFCHEYYLRNCTLAPSEIYYNLNRISKAPFSAFCKLREHYIISASPERFIRKEGRHLISQPIKGTKKRSSIVVEDEELKRSLRNSSKEKSENTMIVDIVRNDMSRVADPGTVNVDEYLEVYSFKQVHQLISTISCNVKEGTTFANIIESLFPMGSMTGAPKVRAMQLIDNLECTKRGAYSGALGYISPNGDFDFNVIIRSVLYNSSKKYASFMVGSAITHLSNPNDEYEECLLKAKAMVNAVGGGKGTNTND